MKTRYKRLAVVMFGTAGIVTAVLLVLNAFRSNLVFFYSPSEVVARASHPARFRIGGLVEQESLQRSPDGLSVQFAVTDLKKAVIVQYRGVLPDLFREGQGVIAEGALRDGRFIATEVLAKHDEKYMPPEAADAIRKASANIEPMSTP